MKNIAVIAALLFVSSTVYAAEPTKPQPWEGPMLTNWLTCVRDASDLYATFDEPVEILVKGALAECVVEAHTYITALPNKDMASEARQIAEDFAIKRIIRARAIARGQLKAADKPIK